MRLMPLSDGATFAGFTIVRLLGSGGMGEVYLAQHPRLPRKDALKILPAEWSADEEYRSRFDREAALASTLWHPHVVGVHDRGECDGQLWISMDFVDGLDAGRLLAERCASGLPANEAIRIVTAVASGLDYAHKQGLLHRDVKPANIMVTQYQDAGEQRILLTDFGIARHLDDVSGLTATNTTVGTVAYCAPEQLLGEDIDGRADQYALAATAYHLLTGRQLFPHSNPAVVISRHLSTPAPALADIRPELTALNSVLSKALSKNPGDRFATCTEFARALTESAAAPPVPPPTPASPVRAQPPKPVAMPQPDAVAQSTRAWPQQPPPGLPDPTVLAYPVEQPPRKTGRVLTLVVLVVLLLASAGFAATQVLRPDARPASTRAQWQTYVDAATAYVTAMFTYTPETVASNAQRMLDMSVGPLHAKFEGHTDDLVVIMRDRRGECIINGAGLEDLSGDSARVLVAARAKAWRASEDPSTAKEPEPYRLRLTVQKQPDGSLKIADLAYPNGGN